MKKYISFLLILGLLIGLHGCAYQDPVINALPDYKGEALYTSGGGQDYTDYAKYTYDSVTVETLAAAKYFSTVTAEDVEEILLYIENFEGWVDLVGGDLKEHYDFDVSVVSEGDFFYIQTKAGQLSNRKFDNCSLYYFDVDAQILYCFHNSI